MKLKYFLSKVIRGLTHFLTLTSLTFLMTSAFAQPEIKGTPAEISSLLKDPIHLITLRAKHEEIAFSNQVIAQIKISTQARGLSEAMLENEKLRESVVQSLLKGGIAPHAISYASFASSQEEGGWFGSQTDYEVVRRLRVTIDEQSNLYLLSQVVDSSDSIEMDGLEYKHSFEDQVKSEVRGKALEKIMQQKSFYEKNLSVKLTPQSLRELPYDMPDGPVILRGFANNRTNLPNQNRTLAVQSEAIASSANPPSVPPSVGGGFETRHYSIHLAVDFQVEP